MILYTLLHFVRSAFGSWLRVLRLAVYLACVFALLSALAARSLYAQVKEAARTLGRELMDLPELTRNAEVVLINGARLHHARATTKDPISVVFDRFEAHCARHPGPLAEVVSEARGPDRELR